MKAVPERNTHGGLGKGGREEGKLYPICLKTGSTFWWSRGFLWMTFKRINTERWTVLAHGYRQTEGNMELLQKYSSTGWERAPAATCGWWWVPPGSLQPPSPIHLSLHLCSICFSGTPLPSLLPSPLYSPRPSLPRFSPFSFSLAFLHLFPPSLQVANNTIKISSHYQGFKYF